MKPVLRGRVGYCGWHQASQALLLIVLVILVGQIRAAAPDPRQSQVSHWLRGQVVRVVDGDTVRLRADNQRYYTIRLASIDAPEAGGRERPGQPRASAARRGLEDRVLGRRLQARCYDVDNYGRDVCDLLLPEGGTASQSVTRAGLVWANRQFHGKYLRDPRVAALEAEARAARRGLWGGDEPVPPWVWRERCWRQGQCPTM